MKSIFIAIPCMDDMPFEFVKSLTRLQHVGQTTINFNPGSLVYASRDYLAQAAIAGKSDYILWLDSDMVFNSDLLIDMVASLEDGNKDIVTAVCFRRRPPFTPAIYKTIKMGFEGEDVTEAYDDYPDEPFEVDACGFACCLMKTEVAAHIIFREKQCFAPIPGYGEDISFCIRAKKYGYKIWADPRIYVGHIARTVSDRATFEAWRANNGGGK